ncbi:MAG: peptide synthetase [Lachnospiraceae bacterium]|nr:peptide synthetase [Lachnospiraceae bacterium]
MKNEKSPEVKATAKKTAVKKAETTKKAEKTTAAAQETTAFFKEISVNGAVVQGYPLTAAQKIHLYTVNACHREELLNIGIGFYIQFADVNFDTLKECIYDGYLKFESMRLRFHTDENGETLQYLVPAEDREIKVYDFSSWKEEDAHEEMTRWTKIPLNRNGGPMNEIALVKLPENYNGIYMKVNHLTMDSTAIMHFCSYVLQLYCSRLYENVEAPALPRSYLAQLNLDLKYEQDSPAMLRDQEYWREELNAPEPIYTSFSERNRLEEMRAYMKNPDLRATYPTGDIEAAIKVYDLEEEPSKRIAAFSREHHVPVAVLLLMALRTVFSKFSGNNPDVSVKNAVARRGTISETKSGGTRIHFFPLRTVIPPETTFMDALKIIQGKENALLRHANYDCIRYMGEVGEHYKIPQGMTYECTTLTYQPVNAANMKGYDIPDMNFKSKWYTNGVAMQHIYVTVMHRPTDDGLSFHFEYQKNEVTEDEMEKLYFYICRTLFKGMEDPNITVGEILDWI